MLSNRPGGKIETHVPGFDFIMGGGLTKSSALLFTGDSDGRKELLVRQICWNLLQEGAKVLYYTVDHSAEELRYDMVSYGWDVKPFEEAGKFRIVDVFSDAAKRMDNVLIGFDKKKITDISFQKGVYDLGLFYKEGIRFLPPIAAIQGGLRITVVDSLSPLLSTNAEEVFSLLHSLKFATRLSRATGIGIVHNGVHENQIEETVKSLADGIISLTRGAEIQSESSLIEVVRYAGEYKRGPFPVEVETRGMRIIPMSLLNLFRTSNLTQLSVPAQRAE